MLAAWVGAYVALFVAVGLFASRRVRNAADYAVARGGMLWARGALSKPWPTESLAKYGNPMTAAGMNGYKQPGRD